MKVLLTGTTGYIGGELLSRLEQEGHSINCLVRNPQKQSDTGEKTNVFRGDLLDYESLHEAMMGVECAFYLVHSMDGSNNFERLEQEAAENFVRAALKAGVKRIVYLGGLGNERDGLSTHLRSRHNVGSILRDSGILTVELRASIVLGAGSISFEMIRSLTEHLPFMVMPKWVSVEAQPIAIDDLLDYLNESIHLPVEESMIVEVGGSDRVSYRDLMTEYARQRNLHRIMLPVPFLTPWLSSHWLGLVTPLYANVGRHLIEGVRNRTVVEHPENARRYTVRPRNMSASIETALQQERTELAEQRWLQQVAYESPIKGHRVIHHRNLLIDYRRSKTGASPHRLYDVLASLGGDRGMFAWNRLWRMRGFIDRCLGGISRPRRSDRKNELKEGENIHFFHVELLDENRRIRLKTDMKLPGEAWLEFGVEQTSSGSLLHHVVTYEPKGLLGLIYWYATYPVHAMVFRGMHRAILREAVSSEKEGSIKIPILQRQ